MKRSLSQPHESMVLHQLLDNSQRLASDKIAVEDPGKGTISYRELSELSDRVRDRLLHMGVRPGDRVGLYLEKSIEAVASLFGILKAGAAYVPVDPNAPVDRNTYVLNNCSAKVIILEKRFQGSLREAFAQWRETPQAIVIEGTGGGLPLKKALARMHVRDPVNTVDIGTPSPDDLAYILYTSGSTGKPKGVMITHQNALSFIDWCSQVFEPKPEDRFSSHAPFHFDLSIFDLFVSIKHAATLVLIGEEIGKDPVGLARLISAQRISIWYSAPSILSLLAQYGRLEIYDYASLRMVLFAGEVFPVKHLRKLRALLPRPRYFNLYGPTETNVCTFYEVPAQIADDRTQPFPIGKVCSHLRGKIIGDDGSEVDKGQEGELCISGPAVTHGYWGLPDHDARAYLVDSQGQQWYRTGDIVVDQEDGNLIYVGRRDRMVKKRGYRVELGEVEACLYQHPEINEVGVIALSNDENGVLIKAFLCVREQKRLSLIQLKSFCAEKLPLYMIPDIFAFKSVLPKTSTGKVDYQRLKGES